MTTDTSYGDAASDGESTTPADADPGRRSPLIARLVTVGRVIACLVALPAVPAT